MKDRYPSFRERLAAHHPKCEVVFRARRQILQEWWHLQDQRSRWMAMGALEEVIRALSKSGSVTTRRQVIRLLKILCKCEFTEENVRWIREYWLELGRLPKAGTAHTVNTPSDDEAFGPDDVAAQEHFSLDSLRKE